MQVSVQIRALLKLVTYDIKIFRGLFRAARGYNKDAEI